MLPSHCLAWWPQPWRTWASARCCWRRHLCWQRRQNVTWSAARSLRRRSPAAGLWHEFCWPFFGSRSDWRPRRNATAARLIQQLRPSDETAVDYVGSSHCVVRIFHGRASLRGSLAELEIAAHVVRRRNCLGRSCGTESGNGARSRFTNAAHDGKTVTGGADDNRASYPVLLCHGGRRLDLPGIDDEFSDWLSGLCDCGRLSAFLHAAETSDFVLHVRGRFPWRHAGRPRLDGIARAAGVGGAGVVRHRFTVAISALSGDCVALRRGLRDGRHLHAAGGRKRRPLHHARDHVVFHHADFCQPSSSGAGNGRVGLCRGGGSAFDNLLRLRPEAAATEPAADSAGIEASCPALAAGLGYLFAALVRADDAERDLALLK